MFVTHLCHTRGVLMSYSIENDLVISYNLSEENTYEIRKRK